MIKIKKEILEQIKRSMVQDPEYVPKILKRLDSKIEDAIYALLESGFSGPKMFAVFCKALENGLENFDTSIDINSAEYCTEIRECNPEIAKFIIEMCDAHRNQLWILIILYRIYESELEIRCMS